MRAWVALAMAAAACGGEGPLVTDAAPQVHAEQLGVADASEEPEEWSGEQPNPEHELVPAGFGRSPCYRVDADVRARWPMVDAALVGAAARWWRWYGTPLGNEPCALTLVAIDSNSPSVRDGNCKFACEGMARADEHVIALRVDVDAIVEGPECSGRGALLIDVLTHELGHVFGLGHTESGAMAPQTACSAVVPTDDELLSANGCVPDPSAPDLGAECAAILEE